MLVHAIPPQKLPCIRSPHLPESKERELVKNVFPVPTTHPNNILLVPVPMPEPVPDILNHRPLFDFLIPFYDSSREVRSFFSGTGTGSGMDTRRMLLGWVVGLGARGGCY